MLALDALRPPVRRHVADDVFEQLARAILRGELSPGSPMPPERVLVDRFGVSRMIARQAMHRLAELGLVRVKQGGATVVLDPHDATDLRVLSLFYRFAPASSRSSSDAADMIEKQYLQGLSLVEVASRRADAGELSAIADLVARSAESAKTAADVVRFEEAFWRALARASKNRIFRMEVAWWYDTLRERPVPPSVAAASVDVRIAFYRELVRRLCAKDYPVEFYLASVRPILATLLPPDVAASAVPEAKPKKRRRS